MATPTGESRSVRLQSSDGKTFQVPLDVVRVSRTIATMLKELGSEPQDIIPLPNVHSRILNKVLGWAHHYVLETTQSSSPPPLPPMPLSSPPTVFPPPQPRPQPRVPQRSSGMQLPPSHPLSQWDKEFIARNREDVYDLLLAANYLDIKGLLDILCKAVADMIRGKDPQEIRRAFNASEPTTGPTYPPPSTPHHLHHPPILSDPPDLEIPHTTSSRDSLATPPSSQDDVDVS